jgi:hypothetical protein
VLVLCTALLSTACGKEVSGQAQGADPAAGPAGTSKKQNPTTTTKSSRTGTATKSEDPAGGIDGIVQVKYEPGKHTETVGQRVAYDKSPPFGGAHDPVWADCGGIVYKTPVRNEHMVHALEHGTVWIAYHPDQVTGSDLDKLKLRVDGQPYMMLSPYPNLDKPISLQAWGHQLKLDSAGDRRIEEFIKALRANRFTTPEPGARCDTADPSVFNPASPPPFDASAPGPDAMPVTPR